MGTGDGRLARRRRQAPATVGLLVWCGVATVVIVGLRALSNYLATVAFALVGSRVATTLRARVFRHVQGLSQQFHSRNRSADTVQRLVSDVGRMQEVAGTAGLPLVAWGLIFNLWLCVPGGLLVVAGIYGWILEPSTEPGDHHGRPGRDRCRSAGRCCR